MAINFDPFDDVESAVERGPHVKPFWTLDFDDEDKLKDWLNSTWDLLRQRSVEKRQRIRKNIAAYKGIHYQAQDIRSREILTRTNVPVSRNPKLIANNFFDFVEQHVSRVTKYRPNIAVDPAHDEFSDKMTARSVKEIIDAIWYRVQIDVLLQNTARIRRLGGESYLGIYWNPKIGDLHPDAVAEIEKAKKKGKEKPRVPLLDSKGQPIYDQNGVQLFIDEMPHIGDVDFKLEMPWQIELQRKGRYRDCEWAFHVELTDLEDLKAEYKEKANDIKPSQRSDLYEFSFGEHDTNGTQVELFHFWHKKTDKLEQGRHIVFTRDGILKSEVHPYDHGQFPWIRSTDIDVPGQLDGFSTMDLVRPVQTQHNNVLSMLIRNLALCAHPKWMMPRGSVKVESLGNDSTVVQYQGPVPPSLAVSPVSPPEAYNMLDRLEAIGQKLSGVYGVSRGEPPAGIKAGVALQFLDEQETERSNSIIAKHNALIKDVADMTKDVAAQFYGNDDAEDEYRLRQLLGPKLDSFKSTFKMEDIKKPTVIRLQTSSALPMQKAARVQSVLDLREAFPNRITDDQALSMLEFGQPDKFIDIATTALQSAEMENDEIFRANKVSDPEAWEDHVTHYRIHLRQLNDKGFSQAPKGVQNKLIDHVTAHEMLMVEIGARNPAYLQTIAQEFPAFPIFYKYDAQAFATAQGQGVPGMGGMAGMPQGPQMGSMAPMGMEAPVSPEGVPAGVENMLPTDMGMSPTEGL